MAAGVVTRPRDGVKILGDGELKAKLAFEVAAASKSGGRGDREAPAAPSSFSRGETPAPVSAKRLRPLSH